MEHDVMRLFAFIVVVTPVLFVVIRDLGKKYI